MTDGGVAIELRALTKAFGDRRVLDDVSLVVPVGRTVCILGRSGTGKSVALKHIVGLIKPDAGQVIVHEEDITRMTGRELARVRRRIGFLFQDAALFDSISVGENVAFPLRRHSDLGESAIRTRVLQLLTDVGLEAEYDKMPADLSGGMRKRAGLARALALNPSILLADEPSAGLDPVTAAEIDALLVEPQEGRCDAARRHAQHSERAGPRRRTGLPARRQSARAWLPRESRTERAPVGARIHAIGRIGLAGPTRIPSRSRSMGTIRTAVVGAFVLGGTLLFAAGLFLIGDRRLLFEPQFELSTTFGKVSGLQIGTKVRVAGFDAGEVLEVLIPSLPSQKFVVRMRLREDLRALVRVDSVCAVQTDGIVGNAFIQIGRGTDAARIVVPGDTLEGADPVEFADLIQEGRETFRTVARQIVDLSDEVSEAIGPLTDTARTASTLLVEIGNDVKAITETGSRATEDARVVIADTRGIVNDIRAGRGTIGQLLTDDSQYKRWVGIANEAEKTAANLRMATERARSLIEGVVRSRERRAADCPDASRHAYRYSRSDV